MPTITAGEFRNGVTFEMDGKIMGEVRESDRLFWLPVEDTSVLLPKSALKEGTEDNFRRWLKSHSRRYRVCKVTDRLRRSLERE